ncbi:antibiotic biosynthesis monooxygenase family protein [Streptomyces kebangsaanensis]|uniref:antibiotic biosynthesis monooxygenase family protein n=1 Tax=Streptomyces kebangsaanensis TaxID=864058 RepID=UPI000A9DE7D8|nr:antibiotic biosynthesis monooxygenase family protein [Streptomyces kebangsaanensis]
MEAYSRIGSDEIFSMRSHLAFQWLLLTFSGSDTLRMGVTSVVVFMNRLTMIGEPSEFERIYAEIGKIMSARPGLIRFRLVRSTKEADVYFNIAEWESEKAFQDALKTPEFRAQFEQLLPIIKGDPHVCEVVQEGLPAVHA